MRKLIALACAMFCLGAGDSAETLWSVRDGTWDVQRKTILGQHGTLLWKGEVPDTVIIQCKLTILAWTNEEGAKGMAGILWQTGIPDKPRYQMLVRKDGRITIAPHPDPDNAMRAVNFPVALGKTIPIALVLDKDCAKLQAGKQTMLVKMSNDPIGGIALCSNGCKVRFDDVRISKNKK